MFTLTSATMKLLPLVCLCALTRSGFTSADENDGVLKDRSQENIPGAAPEPYIKIHEARDWSLLVCEVRGVFPKPKVEWKSGAGNIIPAEQTQVSDKGGSFDITVSVTANKSNYYRCVVTQEEIKHRISAETYLYFESAASKPSITTLEQTKDWSLLQCEVRSPSSRPKVEWQDSAGNKLPAEDTSSALIPDRFTLRTTVTKTDYYRCVATQEEINHQISAKTYVYIGSSTGWIVAVVILAIAVVVLAAVVAKLCITLKSNEG
ncbi:uncharacterized protein LOC117256559 [Epinephelus lanceolatus]